MPPISQRSKFGRSGKRSSQSLRDYEKIQHRIKASGSKIEFVSNYIDRYFGTHVTSVILLSLAKIFIGKLDLKLDRLAKRNRSALLCWYAENWDSIYANLKDTDFLSYITNQGYPSQSFAAHSTVNEEIEEPKPHFDPTDISFLLNTH